MSPQAAASALMGMLASLAAAADTPTGQFAFGMPVVTGAEGAAYRVALPLSVYRDISDADLRDIRVFNARGEVVPYALERPASRTSAQGPGIALPLFALRGDPAAAADAVRVTIDAPNAAVNLQTRSGAAPAGGIRQYILDGRPQEAAVAALRLDWPEAAADFSGRLRVDASDDFAAWRTIADAAPVANLHANGQQLVRNRIELEPVRAKYWRLSWIGKNAPFELSAVVAEPADSRIEADRSTLEVAGNARAAAPGEYLFDVGARLPIERVNLELPEVNTVLAVELLSRMHLEDPWRRVAQRQFYRVDTADGELRNHDVEIGADSDRYWLARAANLGVAAAARPPRLRVAWTPANMVFLARGPAPYLLAYGSAGAPSAETDLSTVSAAITVLPATLGERRALGGEARLAPPAAPFPWRQTLLWGVLGLGVCVLGWMAYRLTKDMGGDP